MSDADEADAPPEDGDVGFDKEAERRRLREKYERDQEGRRTTQRMSELLLQGATMTNKHCDTCGNPIFRYEGREFCSVCDDPTATEPDSAQEPPEGQPASMGSEPEPSEGEPSATPVQDQPTRAGAGGAVAPSGANPNGDLATARAALVDTLVSLSQAASETRDVRRRRESLEAAREAAEAIAALDRIN